MTKPKKITIKPFLQDKVEPLGMKVSGGKKAMLFPLYYIITYNRKNQSLRSRYAMPLSKQQFERGEADKVIEFETKVFQKIIRLEAHPETGEYDMKGMHKRIELYSLGVRNVLNSALKQGLKQALPLTKSNLVEVLDFQNERIDFLLLLEAAEQLFPNLNQAMDSELKANIDAYKVYDKLFPLPIFEYNFATAIDWADQSHQKELEEMLLPMDKQKRKQILKSLNQMMTAHLQQI